MSEEEPLNHGEHLEGEETQARVLPEVTEENIQSLVPAIQNDAQFKSLVEQLETEQPQVAKWLVLWSQEGEFTGKEKEIAITCASIVYQALRSQIEKSKMQD